MSKDQRGNVRGSINQPRIPQPKTVQQKPLQPVPHINQHSAYLQRVAQAKMAQTRTAPQLPNPAKLNRPNIASVSGVKTATRPSSVQPKLRNAPAASRPSGVVQRADCLSGVGEFLTNCWNSLPSCCPPSRRDQYTEISDLTESRRESTSSENSSLTSGSKRIAPVTKATWVQEEKTENDLPYPGSVHGGYISSCALVIFCGDDSFDCYHAKGGNYKTNHRLRPDPKRIYYVYKVEINDTERTIEEYQRNANFFRQLAGNKAPLKFFGQAGVNGNVWVDVNSLGDISPRLGTFK